MKQVDQIIYGKWLIPCESQNEVLEDHALVITDGLIVDILPGEQVKNQYAAKKTEHFETHAIMPGFINAHTHVAMNYFRGLADDLALLNWLNNHIWPAEKKALSPEFVYDASLFAMAEMIRSGTTCFNDMFFYMPNVAEAVDVSGMRGAVGIHFIGVPNNGWARSFDEEYSKGMAFYEEYKNHKRVIITAAAHSLYMVSEDAWLLKIRDLTEQYQLQLNMHVQEPKSEIETVMKKSNLRPLQRLNKLGMLNSKLIAVHLLHVNDDDMELLIETKPNVVHCPQSNMKLASGLCPVTELTARGINVALGTDSVASNNDLNMFGEMRTASFLAKHVTNNPESLPAGIVLQMATLNGAKALKKDHLIGSLKVGKAADFIAIQLEEMETFPVYHPISQIVYAASRQQVTDVWVAGKQLLKNRTLTTLDERELFNKAKYWANQIADYK